MARLPLPRNAAAASHTATSCSRSMPPPWPLPASCAADSYSTQWATHRFIMVGEDGGYHFSASATSRTLSLSCRLQLALVALLRRVLLLFPPESSAHANLFDPILSAVECAAASALGFSMPGVNDGYRRYADEPTLFYMLHCEASLYDALLAANWEPPSLLRHVCVLGNSFHNYAIQVEVNRSGPAAKGQARPRSGVVLR
uniref:SRR1-like domain-containing protein n=1 Tax=Oryza meridionalis TaxID=40149 RepID=A0A0E0EPE8_9ORYZ